MKEDLPFARRFRKRCKARITPTRKFSFWGRCELRPHGQTIEHCLRRGQVRVRWSNSIVRYE